MAAQRAWIGLGANLGDPAAAVRAGLQALAGLPDTVLGPVSGLYRTAPVGVTDQADFCNAVAGLDTSLAPQQLLTALQRIESAHGRVRMRRWGPRQLDLDVLLYGDQVIDQPALTVPHPRLQERAFVLVPLAELAPGLQVPGVGRVDALAGAVAGQGIIPWEPS